MKTNLQNQIETISKQHKSERKQRRLHSIIGGAAAFAVLGALLLPAFTLEKPTYCGLEEHTHTDECFEYVLDCPVTGESGVVISAEEFNKLPGAGSYDGEVWEMIATDGDFRENLRVIEEETSEEDYEDETILAEAEETPDGEGLVVSMADNATPSDYESDYAVVTSEGVGPVIADNDAEADSSESGNDEETTAEEEQTPASTEEAAAHVHTAECYRKVVICGLEEHEHGLECYIDKDADVEDLHDLEALFPTFEDEKVKDSYEYAGKLAEFQQGYRESVKNYMVLIDEEDNETPQGYTRYGDWAGDEYAVDWSPLFAAFTAEYAGLDIQSYDKEALTDAATWMENLRDVDLWTYEGGLADGTFMPIGGMDSEDAAEDLIADLGGHVSLVRDVENYIGLNYADYLEEDEEGNEVLSQAYYDEGHPAAPAVGELVFLDLDEDTYADHVGIITAVNLRKNRMSVMVGDIDDRVKEEKYSFDDMAVLGFVRLPETAEAIQRNREVNGETESEVELESFGEIELESEADEEETAESEVEVEIAYMDDTVTVEGDDYAVSLTVGADAQIPEWAEVSVEEITEGSPEYQTYLSEALAAGGNDTEISFARFFDITFTVDGTEIEPKAPVAVEISYDDTVEIPEEGYRKAVHFANDGSLEVMNVAGEEEAAYEEEYTAEEYTVTEAADGSAVSADQQSGQEEAPVLEDTVSIKDRKFYTQEYNTSDFNKDEAFATAKEHEDEVGIIGGVKKLGRGLRRLFIKDTLDLESEMGVSDNAAKQTEEVKEASSETGSDNAVISSDNIETIKDAADSAASDQHAENSRKDTKKPAKAHAHKNTDRHTFSFVQGSFSVTGTVIYTVDFEYEVDGKTYQFSLPGGEVIALSDLVEVLGIVGDTSFDTVDDFMAAVESVEFSDPSLVKVVYPEEDITVRDILERLGVENQLSAAIGEEEAQALEERIVRRNEWTLVSIVPFDTDESLSITMKNGDVITVKVTDAQSNETNDLTKFLHVEDTDPKAVEFKINGQDVSDSASDPTLVHDGDQFSLTLNFREINGGVQFPSDDTWMEMPWPEALTGVSFNTGDTFDMNVGTDSHGQPIMVTGNKIKVENGKLMIQWNTADEQHFADLKSSGVAHMEIRINGTIDSSKETIKFTDQITKYIQADPNNSVDLAKSGNYNKTTGNVDYTIRVSSNGTNENVTVQDVISNDDNKAALKLNNDIKYTVYNKDGTPVAGKENITISKLNDYSFSQNIGPLTNGQYAVVKYSASVDTTKLTGNGTAEQTTNTVTVGDTSTSTDMQNRIDWLTFRKEAGEVTGDGNTKIVNWTITANEDMRGSMAGKTITDTIGYNSRDIMHYVGGITVDVYNGSTKETRTLRWGDNNDNGSLIKTTNSNGQESWTYTVPARDSGNYKYVISYKTEVDVTGRIGNTNVSNSVDIDGHRQDIGKDVPPGTDKVNINKSHGAVTEANTDWTVSFNVPANGLSDAYIEDWLPKKSNEMIDEYTAGSLTVTSNGTAILAYTGNESGGNPQEYYVLTDSSSDLNSPHFRIDFYRWDATAGKYVLGLAPQATERIVVASFKTNTDSKWAKTYLPGSGNEYHTNTAILHVGNQQIQDDDTIVPPYTGINKEGWREGTVTIDGVEYPLYHYKVTLYGVTDWHNVKITDTHDSRLKYLNVIRSDGTALRGDASKIQVFYTGNYEKTPWDSTANTMHRPSFKDEGTTLTIQATAANQLPMNESEYCTNYSVEYYMIPADIKAMQQASIASAKTDDKGITKMENTAKWDTHTDDAEVTYQYDGVKKNYTTPYGNERVLHFEIELNPSAQKIGTGDTLTMTDTFENLSVDYSSIVVTHLDGTALTAAEKALTSWDYHGNEGTFIIPNGVALKVAYDARVVGNGTVTFRNKAVMEGFEASNEHTYTYTIEGSGGAENYKVRIYKYAAGHMESGLGDAKFRLLNADKQPIKYPVDYKDASLRGEDITFTTNAEEGDKKGYVTVMLDSSEIGYALAKDTVYYLEEIKEPDGFEKDYIQYSFEISDHSDYDNKNGVYRYHNDDILKISNKPEEGGLILAKSISGINENKLTAEEKELINNITFEVTGIFQHVKTDAEGNPVLDEHDNEVYEQDASATTRAIKYSQFTDGRYRIDPKEIVVGQKYTVVEKNAGIEGYQLATTYKIDGGQVVEAFPDEDGVVFTDDDISAGKSHRVTISNRYTTHAYNFTKYEQGTISTAEPVLLEGAEFTVYKYNAETGKFEKTEKVYTTDEYGEFGIRWIDRGYEYDTAYYVVETKAPAGYEVMPDEHNEDYPEGPLREKYYFYFSRPDASEPSAPAGIPTGSSAVDLSLTDPANVNVENAVLEETTTKIEVRKEWKELNASGQPGNNISAETIAEQHPEWVENGIPFYVYQVTRTDSAFTSADLKEIAQADMADPEHRQGVLYTTEENPTGEYKITYDPNRNFKWQGLVLDDLPSSRKLFGKTTYYGYYVVDNADGFIAAYDYDGTKFENFTYEGQSNYLGHLELWNVQEPTELYVKKVLVGPEQEISRVSDIQFRIYRDPHEGEEGDSDHNGWVLVKTNPETMSMTKDASGEWGYRNQDGSLKAISGLVKGEVYHVVETKVAPDDLPLSVWDVEVSDDNVFHGGETATITNTYKGKYLSVKKEWDIEGDLPSSITIRVYRREKGSSDSFVRWKEESLNQNNNWTKFWKSNEMELNGKEWEYYVEEVTTGYYTQISATEDNPLEIAGTIIVRNSTKYDGEISVNKVWKNKDNGELETEKVPNEVEVILQRAEAEVQGCKVTLNVNLVKGSYTEVITREVTVPEGTQVKFKIEGNGVNEYTGITEWLNEYHHPAGGYVTLTASGNSVSESVTAKTNGHGWESVNVSIENESSLPSVSLNRITDYQDVEGKEIVLTKPNWSYTWENLPTDAGNNQVYVYSVREVSVDGKTPAAAGFVSVVTGQDTNDGTVTVTNTETDQPKGSISVTKNVKVDEEDSAELNNQRITIGLFKSDTEPANDAEPTQTEMLTITGATTTQNSLFSNLDLGTYWVYELDSDNHPVKNGGTLAVNAKSYTVTEDSPNVTLDSENLEGSVEITNSRDETVSATVNIYKIKKDDEETKTPLKDATFTITKVRENLSTSTPTIDTSWTDAHAEADRTKITNGEGQTSFTGLEAGYYEIRETNTPKGYVITGDAQFYVKVEKTGIKLVKVEQVQEGGTTKYVWSDGTANSNVTFATANNTATVENTPGAALPSTGGPGTRLFTILGSILILGAGVLLWRRRRLI